MAIVHRPPPGGRELGTQRDEGTFVGRQAGILSIYATPVAPAEVVAYYETTYPSYHFAPDTSPPPGFGIDSYSIVGSNSYPGGTANIFVRIRTGSPWIEDGYDIKPRSAPRGASDFVTVLLLGVPN